jgi:hypothetical protein
VYLDIEERSLSEFRRRERKAQITERTADSGIADAREEG